MSDAEAPKETVETVKTVKKAKAQVVPAKFIEIPSAELEGTLVYPVSSLYVLERNGFIFAYNVHTGHMVGGLTASQYAQWKVSV